MKEVIAYGKIIKNNYELELYNVFIHAIIMNLISIENKYAYKEMIKALNERVEYKKCDFSVFSTDNAANPQSYMLSSLITNLCLLICWLTPSEFFKKFNKSLFINSNIHIKKCQLDIF